MAPQKIKPLLILLMMMVVVPICVAGQDIVLRSPNGKAEVRLKMGKTVSYSVYFDQKPVIDDSAIALSVKGNGSIGANPKILKKQELSSDKQVADLVPEKRREIRDAFNELQLTFEGNYGMIWRAYDNGVAYRWTTDLPGQITVSGERVDINL
ncbi:MAG: glycoside hydrolase family 97 N-terminal domain-containing protein, partial [Pyrinomonadaceae bacterium]